MVCSLNSVKEGRIQLGGREKNRDEIRELVRGQNMVRTLGFITDYRKSLEGLCKMCICLKMVTDYYVENRICK